MPGAHGERLQDLCLGPYPSSTFTPAVQYRHPPAGVGTSYRGDRPDLCVRKQQGAIGQKPALADGLPVDRAWHGEDFEV